MPSKSKVAFYAVRKGKVPGVYTTWADCETQTKGFPDARYKKFSTATEAEAFVSGQLSIVESGSTADLPNDTNGEKGDFGPQVLDVSGWDIVYSDGACKGNGKVGSIAGVGVWWGPNDSRNIAERCPGDQTNNRAELIAILRVLETTPLTKKPLLIRTDSQYSISCFQFWISTWQKKNWRTAAGTPVKNAGIIRCISKHIDVRSMSGQKVVLEYVKGHSGFVGNEGADEMANRGALLPIADERDWKSIEEQLERQLSQTVADGGDKGLTVLGPTDVAEEVLLEAPAKVRKVTDDRAAFSTSKYVATRLAYPSLGGSATAQSPSKSDSRSFSMANSVAISNPNQTSHLTSSLAMKQPQTVPYVSPKMLGAVAYNHLSGANLPVKVAGVRPPLVPVPVELVDFNDFEDCWLDASDLDRELSDS